MVKNVLITGANAGLGKECARQLAMFDETEVVYLGCRNTRKAEAAKSELEQATGKKIFEIVQLDLMDLDSVRAAVAALPGPVDGLVLNAGGMGGPTPGELTNEGVTHMFAINVLGHSLLVDELLQAGKLSGVAMYAGSEAARGAKEMRIKRPALKSSTVDEFASVMDGSYFNGEGKPMVSYSHTKYIAAMWMASMARKHPDIRFVTMSPGGTSGTAGIDSMRGALRVMMKYVAMPMMKAFGMMHGVETGASRYVGALNNAEYESGVFYASLDGKSTGPLVDQATIFADLNNEEFQDNANEALRCFLG